MNDKSRYHRYHFPMKLWCQVAVCMLIVGFAGFFWLMLNGYLDAADEKIVALLYKWRSPGRTVAMNSISWLGNQVIFIASIGISGFLLIRKRWARLGRYLLLVGGQEIINLVFKALIARPRPDYLPLVQETGYSFPSGHSMAAFVFYGALAIWLWQHRYGGRCRWLWFMAATIIVFAVGISRIYLGVHYPSDVLAGFMVGATWMLIVLGKSSLGDVS